MYSKSVNKKNKALELRMKLKKNDPSLQARAKYRGVQNVSIPLKKHFRFNFCLR